MKSIVSSTSSNTTVWLCGYLLLTTGVGFFVFWMFFAGTDLSTAVRLIFLAVFILTLKRWTGAILFAFCQLQLFYLERPSRDPEFSVDGWLWGALSVSLLVLLSRYRTLQDREEKPAHRTLYQFMKQAGSEKISPNSRHQLKLMVWQLVKLGCVVCVCAVASWVILGIFPTRSTTTGLNTIREYRLQPAGYRLLVITLSLFAGFFAVWVVINEMIWRRLSVRQSRIYLNSVLLNFMHRDFRMVASKQRRLNQKQIKPRLQSGQDIEEIGV